MASVHSNATLTRTRSTRLPANSSKPLPATPSRGPTSTLSSALPSAINSTTSRHSSTVSNVSLFITNLRLLDLDLHPDWPDINALTFTAKDIAQGQKKRIQCVEWALFHLFYLWDPEEARNKLQPFFPPLDHVQSLNLRAALLRSLEQAKKNGVLGRDAVVRKTMLDECKGERLEEVLAVFSSTVLKKLVAEQQLNQPGFPAIAQSWALENRGYSGERTELSVLVLAHKASLTRHLQSKNIARGQYKELSELLTLKERSLAHRREQAQALEAQERRNGVQDEVTDDVKLDCWRTVRNNWSGNEQWMETLLYGDEHARKDGLLTTPFDRVWRRVQSGRLSELEDQAGGLLQQLDRRVKTQRERLEKWQDFRTKILGKSSHDRVQDEVQPSSHQKGVDLGFGAHENLHLGRMSPRKLPRGNPGQLTTDYVDIIDGLRSELAQVNKGSAVAGFLRVSHHRTVDEPLGSPTEGAISELSELEEEPHAGSHEEPDRVGDNPSALSAMFASAPQTTDMSDSIQFAPSEEEQMSTPRYRRTTLQMDTESDSDDCPPSATPTRPPRRPMTPGTGSPARRTAFPIRISPSKPKRASPERQVSPERAVSPTQELAGQILATMNATSPSPAKKSRHTLSLAERTRLSMARRTSMAPELDDEDEPSLGSLPVSPVRRVPTVTVSEDSAHTSRHIDSTLTTPDEEADEHGYEDLVARTRRSMAGFEASRKKAQLERRRSLRQSRNTPGAKRDGNSYFPSVDEEGDSTLLLAEELMSNEVDDPEAIFKSRPKIKTSPVGSPAKWD